MTPSTATEHDYIPFSRPALGEAEIESVVESLKSGWITTGPKAKRFETEFSRIKKVKHAIALNSCTSALHLALLSLSLPPGSEVITSIDTFAATANIIEQCGHVPVFADTDPETMNISPDSLEAKITEKTKAVIPVHLAGHPADMEGISRICENHSLPVIQDAAHAVDALYKNDTLEKQGGTVCYSFYATKAITTAEGGMLTTDSDKIADQVRIHSLHGMSRDAWKRYEKGGDWRYDIVAPGYKYNMADVNAAIGIVQLNRMDELLQSRRRLASLYSQLLSPLSDLITLPVEKPYAHHSYHLYMIRLNLEKLSITRCEFIEKLKEENIGTSVHFIPFFMFTYYRDKYGLAPEQFPNANYTFKSVISLPLYPTMPDESVHRVCNTITRIVQDYSA